VLDKTKNTVLGDGLLHSLCKNCSGFFWLWGKVVTALEWWWIVSTCRCQCLSSEVLYGKWIWVWQRILRHIRWAQVLWVFIIGEVRRRRRYGLFACREESRMQQISAKSSVTKCDSLKTRPLLPAGSYRTFGVRNCSISKNWLVTSLPLGSHSRGVTSDYLNRVLTAK